VLGFGEEPDDTLADSSIRTGNDNEFRGHYFRYCVRLTLYSRRVFSQEGMFRTFSFYTSRDVICHDALFREILASRVIFKL
jgi:hypothetical protein